MALPPGLWLNFGRGAVERGPERVKARPAVMWYDF
jgi:hypothetical protein